MLNIFSKSRRFSATFKTEVVEFNGEKYQIRELDVSEREAFSTMLNSDEMGDAIALCFIIKQACAQFTKVKEDVLLVELSTSFITFLAEEILRLSEIGGQHVDELEKKSESNQN